MPTHPGRGLDTIQYHRPAQFNTSPMSLQSAYNHALHLAVAARELDMGTLQLQAQMTLMLMTAIAECQNVTLEHRVDGADMAEIMLSLIDEETTWLCSIQPIPEDHSDADEQPISSSLLVTNPNPSASASPVTLPSTLLRLQVSIFHQPLAHLLSTLSLPAYHPLTKLLRSTLSLPAYHPLSKLLHLRATTKPAPLCTGNPHPRTNGGTAHSVPSLEPTSIVIWKPNTLGASNRRGKR